MTTDPHMIDLTPVGAQTPEGCARLNKAMKELEEAKMACADEFAQIYDQLCDGGLAYNLQNAGFEEEEAREISGQLQRAWKRWSSAGEELARATAGVPPRG